MKRITTNIWSLVLPNLAITVAIVIWAFIASSWALFEHSWFIASFIFILICSAIPFFILIIAIVKTITGKTLIQFNFATFIYTIISQILVISTLYCWGKVEYALFLFDCSADPTVLLSKTLGFGLFFILFIVSSLRYLISITSVDQVTESKHRTFYIVIAQVISLFIIGMCIFAVIYML